MASEHEKGGPSSSSSSTQKSRRDLFGDCALVELIHLHDCLRGALKALERDLTELSQSVLRGDYSSGPDLSRVAELERRVAGRFKVIWSVFRAHSAAEDEFIWPALQSKQRNSNNIISRQHEQNAAAANHPHNNNNEQAPVPVAQNNNVVPADDEEPSQNSNGAMVVLEQEEYEEDHADEERMFRTMDGLLTEFRAGLLAKNNTNPEGIKEMALRITKMNSTLSKHLLTHLEKEETHCMPLVKKFLTSKEIHDLVGLIMGRRSSDTISQILTMAVQNLDHDEREEMVRYMKQAMVGTFFERWLSMGGWMLSGEKGGKDNNGAGEETGASLDTKPSATDSSQRDTKEDAGRKRPATNDSVADACPMATGITKDAAGNPQLCSVCESSGRCLAPSADKEEEEENVQQVTSAEELEKLIRVVAANHGLTPAQKSTTIQGLRDSVWKSNQKYKKQKADSDMYSSSRVATATSATTATITTRTRRDTPPYYYYKKNRDGVVEQIWNSDTASSKFPPDDKLVPLFSAAELAPTYHDGATGAVLGCPHYARSCKLRHPSSGRLYTCRLCCQQEREMPMKDQDSPLDRYAVTEVLCMRCGTLQPAQEHCINPECEHRGKPFARYYCRLCNMHDDDVSKSIYHCPFCNVCRKGKGLGIDFRHCMRCNACVSLADDEHHCIPQRLQGSCPICHESMFESTEPLRGLKCGHVMHLSCFGMYRRGQNFTCPLCKKSVEDMKEYFSLLDAAVRMQPMPAAYSLTFSNICCQDCEKTGKVKYHFVGCKCPHCGSYNTRELGRVQECPKDD